MLVGHDKNSSRKSQRVTLTSSRYRANRNFELICPAITIPIDLSRREAIRDQPRAVLRPGFTLIGAICRFSVYGAGDRIVRRGWGLIDVPRCAIYGLCVITRLAENQGVLRSGDGRHGLNDALRVVAVGTSIHAGAVSSPSPPTACMWTPIVPLRTLCAARRGALRSQIRAACDDDMGLCGVRGWERLACGSGRCIAARNRIWA